MLGRGGILLCPRGFPAVTVRLKLRDGAAKSPCTCGLDSEIYNPDFIAVLVHILGVFRMVGALAFYLAEARHIDHVV